VLLSGQLPAKSSSFRAVLGPFVLGMGIGSTLFYLPTSSFLIGPGFLLKTERTNQTRRPPSQSLRVFCVTMGRGRPAQSPWRCQHVVGTFSSGQALFFKGTGVC